MNLCCGLFFLLLMSSSYILSHPIAAKKVFYDKSKSPEIATLKDFGKKALNNKLYFQAVRYFSGIMHLLEGDRSSHAQKMRLRFGLHLADSEMKLSNYERAIARYSECIEEALDELSQRCCMLGQHILKPETGKLQVEQKSLLRSLALSHFRRAVCLKLLNKLPLALVDLQLALEYQPDDNNILEEIVDIHFKHIAPEHPSRHYQSSLQLMEELNDYVEECRISFPKMQVSRKLLHELISQKVPQSVNSVYPDFSAFFGNNAPPVLGFKDVSMLKHILPLFGLSRETTHDIVRIADAFGKVFTKLKRLASFVRERRSAFICGSTVLWLLFAVLDYYFVI
jgi:tetratricopeptide (TPR) repeat protein